MTKKETKKVETEKEVRKGFVDNCALLNVRSTPNADNGSNLTHILNAGTEVDIIEDANDEFYKIKVAKGYNGYVMKKFITLK